MIFSVFNSYGVGWAPSPCIWITWGRVRSANSLSSFRCENVCFRFPGLHTRLTSAECCQLWNHYVCTRIGLIETYVPADFSNLASFISFLAIDLILPSGPFWKSSWKALSTRYRFFHSMACQNLAIRSALVMARHQASRRCWARVVICVAMTSPRVLTQGWSSHRQNNQAQYYLILRQLLVDTSSILLPMVDATNMLKSEFYENIFGRTW